MIQFDDHIFQMGWNHPTSYNNLNWPISKMECHDQDAPWNWSIYCTYMAGEKGLTKQQGEIWVNKPHPMEHLGKGFWRLLICVDDVTSEAFHEQVLYR